MRRVGWLLVAPLAVLAGWAGVNRATTGVTSVSTVIGFNMIDHVGAYVQAGPGPDHPITAAYVAARTRREAHSHSLGNVSYDALPAMERATGLDAAHLSGRLLGIAEGVIRRHPLQYLASSLKQWPRFWLPPNYAYEFARGGSAGAVRVLWKAERVVLALINIAFVLLLVAELARRALAREGLLRRASLILAGVPVVGLVPATFLAFGETGRYGYVYFPLVLGVCASSAQIAWRALAGWAARHPGTGTAAVSARTTPIR